MSQWEIDCRRISEISFDSSLSQKQKNLLISKIEQKMEKMEDLELSGKETGYYL